MIDTDPSTRFSDYRSQIFNPARHYPASQTRTLENELSLPTGLVLDYVADIARDLVASTRVARELTDSRKLDKPSLLPKKEVTKPVGFRTLQRVP